MGAFENAIFAHIDEAREASRPADLSGVVFPASVDFQRCAGEENSLPAVLFNRTIFSAPACFEGVTFRGPASFAGTIFDGQANFDSVTFRENASFKGASFSGPADFRGVIFGGEVNFEGTRFSRRAWFIGSAPFRGNAWFSGAKFEGGSFQGASFSGLAHFDDASFSSTAYFDGAIFNDQASFINVIFGDATSFTKVTFNWGARFRNVTFHRSVNFDAVDFKVVTDFRGAAFRSLVSFEEALFSTDAWFQGDLARGEIADSVNYFWGRASFRKANFNGRANFIGRHFMSSTDFRDAVFAVAPEFHNSILHQDTRFAGTDFRDRKGTGEVDAAMAYRTLKLAMESVRAREEEARFYAYEQQALRAGKDTSWSLKLFSWLYEKTADYGRSFVRPLALVLLTFFAFFLVYLAALTGPTITWSDVQRVLRFALTQVFQPFGAFRTSATVSVSAAGAVPVGLALVAAIHSILTFAFLALFLLALRRRFKLD